MQTEQEIQISTEVVGHLTDAQRQELNILGLTIFDAKKLDPKNPEHIAQVQATLEGCVYRGLDMQGRVWFSSSEQVSPIFEMGLGQRETIVDQLQRMNSVGTNLKYITVEEASKIRNIASLDPDFSEADKLLGELRGRRAAIAKFHQALFEQSQLAPEARALKSSVEVIAEEGVITEQDKEWLKYNMLYGNLIVNLALYQQVGISVEPKDVAALSEIWKDITARDNRQTELVEKMKQVAKGLGIPEQHIEAYTKTILEDMNVTMNSGRVTLEEVRGSDIFAITTQDILNESLEFEQPQEKNEVVYFPEEDLVEARSTIQKIREMFKHIDTVARETKNVVYKTHEDDPVTQYVDNEYVPFLAQLTPLELSLTYYAGLRDAQANDKNDYARLEDELQQTVPLHTYLEALTMLQTSEFKVLETEEGVSEFEDEGKNLIYKTVKNHVIQCLLEDKFGDDITYDEIIDRLPVEVLSEYLKRINPARLSNNHIKALIGLDIQKWLDITLEKGVHAEADPNKQGDINLVFDVDSEFIRNYFNKMPVEKQQAIAKKLQHIIVF